MEATILVKMQSSEHLNIEEWILIVNNLSFSRCFNLRHFASVDFYEQFKSLLCIDSWNLALTWYALDNVRQNRAKQFDVEMHCKLCDALNVHCNAAAHMWRTEGCKIALHCKRQTTMFCIYNKCVNQHKCCFSVYIPALHHSCLLEFYQIRLDFLSDFYLFS